MNIICLIIALFLLQIPVEASANDSQEDPAKGNTGLPLPRFAALRTDEVNMRTGPGTRYPIEWVFVKQHMPVEITAEFDIWRRIRDFEGSEGWIHKSALTGKRSLIVKDSIREIYKSDSESSSIIAHVESGTIGLLEACSSTWCKVNFDGTKGYMKKSDFWGAYPQEIFD